ncbi:hypothetical protein GCM10011594_30800 [Nakamurella endophytica]|uniref:Uncharacterized protein n=1 Tax=Nakamurella endophytica TaxID=1748367 RepID=A0A917T5C6_9ACTN|nr:hypothetical protein GCM10011594_30800 [Nakamurella endophytica]
MNTVLAAEAFLTISYTATMSSTGRWAVLVAPTLAVLGLVLAVLAWPGIHAAARLVALWTHRLGEVEDEDHEHEDDVRTRGADAPLRDEVRRRRERDQRRGMLLFRWVPPVFAAVWVVLLVTSVTLKG